MPHTSKIPLPPGTSPARVVCSGRGDHRAKVLWELAVGQYADSGFVRILWRRPSEAGWREHPDDADGNAPFDDWGGPLGEWDPRWREDSARYKYGFACPACGRNAELRKARLFDLLREYAARGLDAHGRVVVDISELDR